MDEDRVPNRQLTPQERDELYAPLMADVGAQLLNLAAGDADLLWALRRKLAKELTYLERSKPAQRKALKKKKVRTQDGICPECRLPLPESNNVLDRLQAMGGYTFENTRLLCRPCDIKTQSRRGYA
jgi:hypothetical protein